MNRLIHGIIRNDGDGYRLGFLAKQVYLCRVYQQIRRNGNFLRNQRGIAGDHCIRRYDSATNRPGIIAQIRGQLTYGSRSRNGCFCNRAAHMALIQRDLGGHVYLGRVGQAARGSGNGRAARANGRYAAIFIHGGNSGVIGLPLNLRLLLALLLHGNVGGEHTDIARGQIQRLRSYLNRSHVRLLNRYVHGGSGSIAGRGGNGDFGLARANGGNMAVFIHGGNIGVAGGIDDTLRGVLRRNGGLNVRLAGQALLRAIGPQLHGFGRYGNGCYRNGNLDPHSGGSRSGFGRNGDLGLAHANGSDTAVFIHGGNSGVAGGVGNTLRGVFRRSDSLDIRRVRQAQRRAAQPQLHGFGRYGDGFYRLGRGDGNRKGFRMPSPAPIAMRNRNRSLAMAGYKRILTTVLIFLYCSNTWVRRSPGMTVALVAFQGDLFTSLDFARARNGLHTHGIIDSVALILPRRQSGYGHGVKHHHKG